MRLLINVVTGPENATRAALGLLVARTAAAEGHEVRVFLGGDGVNLARPETAEAHSVASGVSSSSTSCAISRSPCRRR